MWQNFKMRRCDNKPMTGQQVEIKSLIWHQFPGQGDHKQKRVSYKNLGDPVVAINKT